MLDGDFLLTMEMGVGFTSICNIDWVCKWVCYVGECVLAYFSTTFSHSERNPNCFYEILLPGKAGFCL